MFDREEKEQARYLEGEGLGGLKVVGRLPSGQMVRVVFVVPSIAPDIIHGVDHVRQSLYLCKNKDYVVFVKNFKGQMLRVIHREHKNKLLVMEDRKAIVDWQLFGQPPELKKLLAV